VRGDRLVFERPRPASRHRKGARAQDRLVEFRQCFLAQHADPGANGFEVPAAPGGTGYYVAEIMQTGDKRRMVKVFVRRTDATLSVAGIDRSW
jgi:hypothetical protein